MAIVALYAWLMNRWEAEDFATLSTDKNSRSLTGNQEPN